MYRVKEINPNEKPLFLRAFRASIKDPYGRKIILLGKYAFNYSIYIEGITGRVVIETYKNGTIARKRFNELKKK